MASGRGTGVRQKKDGGGGGGGSGGEAAMLKQLVQTLRGDLNLLSNEARKKYPAVRESAERGAMSLKSLSESKGFSLKVLASTDDVVHPLLFACETKNPAIVKIGLSSLQKLIQYNSIPQKSVESIVATLNGLMNAGVEELRIIQTILLLVTSTDVVQGKALTKVLVLCFKLYASKEPSIHSMAGVAIRQIVSALFERVSKSTEEEAGQGAGKGEEQQMPSHTRDAYLLFQDICFLTNGDPPAWLPASLDLELALGLELLEMVLRTYPNVFVKDKIFNQLLTERVCPLIVKLFSPTSKYKAPSSRLSPTTAALLATDKPTFSLSVRLLRILNVLIREFYASLITQCEIFLSMLVKFLDSDKPLWQRTLAVEVLHAFCNQPNLLRSFCESYDMQEHSSKIFGDIVDGLGGFIQSNLTSQMIHSSLMAITSPAPSTGVTNNSSSHVISGGVAGTPHMHMFTIKNMTLQAEFLPQNSHSKPAFLEMLEKTDIPLIPDGYPLVVAMNALMDAIKSVSLVVNDKKTTVSVKLKEVMLKSSWSGVMAALAILLDTCSDERTTAMILEAHQTFIYLCGKLQMTSPRDAFITSLCKACLPTKYAMSLITQRGPTKSQASSTAVGPSGSAGLTGSPRTSKVDYTDGRSGNEGAPPSHIMPTTSSSEHSLRHLGARRKLNLSEISGTVSGGGASEGVAVGGASLTRISSSGSSLSGGGMMGGVSTPAKERDQSSTLLTVKNLHCIETLLSIISNHGNFLDSAWQLIMTTIQHVVELFGLVPQSSGGFKKSGMMENSSLALVSVDKRKELSEVSEKLTNLFKGSQSLSDSSLTHLIQALTRLSTSSLQGSAASKEQGLFPLAALLDVGNSNMARVELMWSPVTAHLGEVCSIGSPSVRTFAADALTLLIRTSLENYSEERVQLMLLRPLEGMTRVPHSDVRQKQMDCITHILHSSGQSLGSSWSIILEVISSATRLQNENLVRAGFQSLQLVIADFLPAIPSSCIPSCVEVGGQYALQTMDINISLTSIGILWNMADYLFQSKATLQDSLEDLKSQAGKSSQTSLHASFLKKLQGSTLTVFDSLWMLLFKHLSDLCVDERSAVRKSACQTLFSTISAHGTLLQKETWQEVLWKVLFPLLGGVSERAGSASTSSFQTAIMIHHSRDTEQKQWAETQVLTLTGTARLIQSRWFTLASLDGFEKAWGSFLDIIETCSLSATTEVSIAAMKSFHTIIDPQTPSPSPRSSIATVGRHSRSPSREVTPPPPTNQTESYGSELTLTPTVSAISLANKQSQMEKIPKAKREAVWMKAWSTWSSIGRKCICERLPSNDQMRSLLKSRKAEEIDAFFRVVPSQAFLVHYLQIFPHVFQQLRKMFTLERFEILSLILDTALLMPVSKDVSPFLVPSSNENRMTNAQRLVLKCYSVVYTSENVVDPEQLENGENQKDLSSSNALLRNRRVENIDMKRSVELNAESCPECVVLYPNVLTELLKCASHATSSPEDVLKIKGVPPPRLPMMSVNYTPFGLGALSLAVQFYVGCVQGGVALPRNTAERFLKTLRVPLKLKHSCPLPVVWMSSVEALLLILETSLPTMLESGAKDLEFWRELAAVLEDFLFNEVPEGVQLTADQLREHEQIDIKVIELIKRDILPVSKQAPDEFLSRLTSILNEGSIHSATDQFDGPSSGSSLTRRSSAPFRENFARVCFEALLRFSFINSQEATIASSTTSQLALNALLKRCEEVLRKYADDERLSGSCPLPRSRMNEVSLVLKSVTVLISSLKEAQKTSTAKIDPAIWQHVALLFPALVQCITCTSLDVRQALKEALFQFTDLMQLSVASSPDTSARTDS